MKLLGILPEHNKIGICAYNNVHGSPTYGEKILKDHPVFTVTAPHEKHQGIRILVYTLDRKKIPVYKNTRHAEPGATLEQKVADGGAKITGDYSIVRLVHPIHNANGSITKYMMPKDNPTRPFFPPELIDKYERKEVIPVLYLTEGYFKAWKGCKHGIDVVGVPSITCLRDKATEGLHPDILELIKVCQVERLVWLTDGDCLDITASEINEKKDLYTRPKRFFDTIKTFYDLTQPCETVEKYFAHINSGNIEGNPKGLDDLLIVMEGHEHKVADELHNFGKLGQSGQYNGTYIVRIQITHNVMRINKYFMLSDVDAFYLYHSERRKDLKDLGQFKYNGTIYRYDEETGKCVIEVPKSAADYIRVGNDYYQHINKPDKLMNPVPTLVGRLKSTIIDDNGKDILKHIQKYDDFCVYPNHFNYQQVVHNCWNKYNKFMHTPEEGDCSNTLDYLKHVFGEELVTYTDDGKTTHIPRWHLGLDYIKLLYENPAQILPILCLVSPERQTGKTTFANWLDLLFVENVIAIGNEDMQQDFNAHWVSKLVIICDETKLDKHEVIQKIKRLSTADKIVMNAKGKDQQSLNFFAKFILMSNDADDFIKIDRDEIRFWVIRVPKLTKLNTNLLKDMADEIPAFLHFITRWQMVTSQKERHWFATELLQTDALQRVKDNSITQAEKRILLEIENLFQQMDGPIEKLTLPLDYICELCGQKDKNYVKKSLHKLGYTTGGTIRGSYPYIDFDWAPALNPGNAGSKEPLKIQIVRHKQFVNRAYTFERSRFLPYEETTTTSTAGNTTAEVEVGEDAPF